MKLTYSGFFSYYYANVASARKLGFMSAGISIYSSSIFDYDTPLAKAICLNENIAKIDNTSSECWYFFATSEGLIQHYSGFTDKPLD